MALKWGIASSGRISSDFVNALSTLSENDHKVIAVAAHELKPAKEFADKFSIPNAYGSYLELAQNPDVEIVYVGNLNTQHYDTSRLMLENGKHVLCEKPMCINEEGTKKLIDFAKEKNLFLMEAVWSRSFPSYQYLKKQVTSGALGQIKLVKAEFGLPNYEDERISKNELGGGAILDLGGYPIQLAQWVFERPPMKIKATGKVNEDGVDYRVKMKLIYDDNENQVAELNATTKEQWDNGAVVVGTKGQIKLNAFWSPLSLIDVDGSEKTWSLPEAKHEFNYPHSCGLRFEAEQVRKSIRSGETENETLTHNDSLVIARIRDEIRKQLGVIYPQDE